MRNKALLLLTVISILTLGAPAVMAQRIEFDYSFCGYRVFLPITSK
jgi:hypothetical protein